MRAIVLLLLCGCSSLPALPDAGDASTPDTGSETSVPDAALSDAGDANANATPDACAESEACTCLVDTAPTVDVLHSTTDPNCNPPAAPLGGSIASGTYFLGAVMYFDCCTVGFDWTNNVPIFCDPLMGVTSATFVIDSSAHTIELARGVNRAKFTFSTNGTSITLGELCPLTGTVTFAYTATTTALELQGKDSTGYPFVEELTKQ